MPWSFIALLMLASALLQSERPRIGRIEFFGTGGIDVQRIRAELPVRSGDEIGEEQVAEIKDRLSRTIEKAIGHKPTDVAFVCCVSEGKLTIYVGLGGTNTTVLPVFARPSGSNCLTREALRLYQDAMAALETAVAQGHTAEDDSRGYALSEDATLRARQLAMHEYAVAHQQAITHVLRDCQNDEHRQAAADLLGYGSRSKSQIAVLVRASRDPDETVRNNAVRALMVLAMAELSTATRVPASQFVIMLNSGTWTDRNKAGLLLLKLTRSRDRRVLEQLRSESVQSLMEMARWQDPGHAYPYQVLLGRIAELEDKHIDQLIAAGNVDEIIAAIHDKSR